jgi:hypothetical protein
MAPLDATRITADEGLAEARQKGFLSNVRNVAQTARLEYSGYRGLTLGTSYWLGKSGFNARRADPRVGVIEFDGRYHTGPLALRGEFAQVFVDGAAELNDQLQASTGVAPNIASQMRGFYVEPSVRPLPGLRYDFAAFLRYENFDTQYRMPQGILPLKQFDRDAWVVGASCFRIPMSSQDRLLGGPQPQHALRQRRQPEHRARLVVLMRTGPRLIRRGALVCAAVLVFTAPPRGSSEDRQVVQVTAERFAFTPSRRSR